MLGVVLLALQLTGLGSEARSQHDPEVWVRAAVGELVAAVSETCEKFGGRGGSRERWVVFGLCRVSSWRTHLMLGPSELRGRSRA